MEGSKALGPAGLTGAMKSGSLTAVKLDALRFTVSDQLRAILSREELDRGIRAEYSIKDGKLSLAITVGGQPLDAEKLATVTGIAQTKIDNDLHLLNISTKTFYVLPEGRS